MHLQLIVLACLLQAWSVFVSCIIVYKTTNIECFGNPKRVENISCKVKALNWNKAVAEMDCYLKLPLVNTTFQLATFKKSYSNQYHPFLVNATFNMCDILAKRNFKSYGILFYKIIGRYSNVNHTCPYTGHLFARNLVIDDNIIPVLPLGSYLVFMKIFEGFPDRPTDTVGHIKYYFEAMEQYKRIAMNLRLGIILYLSHLNGVRPDASIAFKATNIECFPEPAFAINAKCYLKAINWNKALTYMDCDLVVPLANVSVHIEVFKRSSSNRYQPFLVNSIVNVCDIISKRNFMTYGMMFWKVIKKYTNVNHSCPIKGHLLARNLSIDENLMPAAPLGFYMISFKFYENYADRPTQFVGTVKYYVNVKEMVKIKQKS